MPPEIGLLMIRVLNHLRETSQVKSCQLQREKIASNLNVLRYPFEKQTMNKLIAKLTPVQWLAVALIVVGVAIMIPRVMGLRNFQKEVSYAVEHDFAAGNLSPDLIRPWMSIRYISVAYAVPQAYLFEAAHIQPRKETSMISINRLNRQMDLGNVDDQPALMKTIRKAILAYRLNPVATGLIERHVEEWMTVQYIANSTGIPVETIFSATGLPAEGNANKPLGFLSDEMNYPGGAKALVAAIQKVVEAEGVKPVIP